MSLKKGNWINIQLFGISEQLDLYQVLQQERY